MCGTPVGTEHYQQGETVIGHLPGRVEGKGRFGRDKAINLVITTARLLCVRETRKMGEKWVGEIFRLAEEEENPDLPWRRHFDSYEWRSPLWAYFYETPADDLLATHRDNQAIPLTDVVSATITFAEEGGDMVDFVLTSGETLRVVLIDQMGRPAGRFLAQALGPQRVRFVSQPAQ
jgi:hypothetical protein